MLDGIVGSVLDAMLAGKEVPVNDTKTWDVGLKVPVTQNGAVLAEFAHTKRTRDPLPENVRSIA